MPSLMQPFLVTSYYEICREKKVKMAVMFQDDFIWTPRNAAVLEERTAPLVSTISETSESQQTACSSLEENGHVRKDTPFRGDGERISAITEMSMKDGRDKEEVFEKVEETQLDHTAPLPPSPAKARELTMLRTDVVGTCGR